MFGINQRCKILKNIETNNVDDVVLIDDTTSHFSLRLVCSQSLFAKKWFVNLETVYMNKKLKMLKENDLAKVFCYVFRNLSNISKNQTTMIINWNSKFRFVENERIVKLNDSVNHASFTKLGQTSFFDDLLDENNTSKMNDNEIIDLLNKGLIIAHFTKVINILDSITIQEGYFVLSKDVKVLRSIIVNVYNKYLEERATFLYERIKLESDERLLKIHNNLFKSEANTCASTTLVKINEYFPPCIEGLLKKLKDVNHLKFKDRLVLTRFFKDAGLSVQECILLFKNNFKDIDEARFNKEYLYSIRHSYGLEGKRASYHSYTCQQVIEMSKDREAFGCPFVNNNIFVGNYSRNKCIEFDIEDAPKKSCCNALKALTHNNMQEELVTPLQFFIAYKKKSQEEK
ncbi:DNA primase subunit pri2 [Binucleata daphniae]